MRTPLSNHTPLKPARPGAAGACEMNSALKGDDGRVSSTATETVSVLMTDLVASTAIADRVGPAAAEGLRAEHFGVLRGALERTGGREVKNLGMG
jgi:class 3 adenylate cyclase